MPTDCDALADRLAISDVLVRYATALDSRDWELWRTCFTEDAVLDYETSGVFDREGFVAYASKALTFAVTQHYVVNHVVELDGDRARSRSYVLAQHVYAADGALFSLGGVYDDELVRTLDGWRVARRHLTSRWSTGTLRRGGVAADGTPSTS